MATPPGSSPGQPGGPGGPEGAPLEEAPCDGDGLSPLVRAVLRQDYACVDPKLEGYLAVLTQVWADAGGGGGGRGGGG